MNLVKIVYSNFGKGGIDPVRISDEGRKIEHDECNEPTFIIHFQYGKQPVPVTFYGDSKENEEVQQWIGLEIIKLRQFFYIRDNQLPIFISSILLVFFEYHCTVLS